jgi:hypothetical protein
MSEESQTTLKNCVSKMNASIRKMWAEMPEVKGSGILTSMTAEDKKLQEVSSNFVLFSMTLWSI